MNILISLIFLFLPLYLVRFSLLGIPTNALEVYIGVVFIVWLKNNFYLFNKIFWKKFFADYKIYIIASLLIIAGLFISIMANGNYRDGFGILKSWFVVPIIVSFMMLVSFSKKDFEYALKMYYASVCIVAGVALAYLFLNKLTYDGRLAAFYESPNYLAMYLAPALFIGWNISRSVKTVTLRYNHSIALTAIGFVLYFTYSYATWIAVLLSFFVVYVTKAKPKKIFLYISILFLFISILFFSQRSNEKLTNISNPINHSSLESRVAIWKSSLLMLKNNWLFGIGPGNFQNKYLEYQKYFPPYPEWAVPQPHNLYLAFWLQSGLVGFAGFLMLIIVWMKNVILLIKKSASSADRENSLATAMLGIIIYTLLHGFLDTPYWKNDLALLFWLVIATGVYYFCLQPKYKPANS